MSYNKVASADITLTSFNDLDTYSAEIVSSNGSILQPFDLSTTLIGNVYKNNIDITDKCTDFRWTKFTPSEDNLLLDEDWTNKHRGMNKVIVTQDDVNSKAVFYFEVYKNFSQIPNNDTLLASDKYTIIDVNDLLTTTEEPKTPYQGQVWVDDSTDPATIRVWNGYKWIVAGAVGAIIKNILKGTGFLSYNHTGFDIIGDTKEIFMPTALDHLGKRYLNLHSELTSVKHRGVKQTTVDEVIPNSDYSFQSLYYSDTTTETFSNYLYLDIYLIGENNQETLVISKFLKTEPNVKKCFYTFETLYDTKAIRVEIYGEDGYRFNFNVGELALYNTKTLYPWTLHPLDTAGIFDRDSLFDTLTDNGRIEGIFSKINPETGQLQYYINASYIGAGLIAAQYLDVYGLTVHRRGQPDIKTLEITEDGDLNLCVNSLTIRSTGQSIQDYIKDQIPEINVPDYEGSSVDVLENEADKEELTARFTYQILYDNSDFKQALYTNNDIDTWLDPNDKPSTEITKAYELLQALFDAYEKAYNNLKISITNSKENYEFNKTNLDKAKVDYGIKLARLNKFFSMCSGYMQDVKIETATKGWSEIKTTVGEISTEVGSLKSTVATQGTTIIGYEKELNTVKQSITPEAMTVTVNNIVTTEEGIQQHFTSISKQTATSIVDSVKNELNGNMSKVEQTVGGIKDTVTAIEKKPNYKLVMEYPDGTIIRTAGSITYAYAKVYNWDEDITDSIGEECFSWYRRSRNLENDTYWHNTYGIGKKRIKITADDINSYATFYFTVEINEPTEPIS